MGFKLDTNRLFSLSARIMAGSQKSNLIIELVIVKFLHNKIIIYFSILLGIDTKILSLVFFKYIYLFFFGVDFFSTFRFSASLFSVIMQKLQKWAVFTFANPLSTLGRNSSLSGDLCLFKTTKSFISNCFPLMLGLYSLAIMFVQAFPAWGWLLLADYDGFILNR